MERKALSSCVCDTAVNDLIEVQIYRYILNDIPDIPWELPPKQSLAFEAFLKRVDRQTSKFYCCRWFFLRLGKPPGLQAASHFFARLYLFNRTNIGIHPVVQAAVLSSYRFRWIPLFCSFQHIFYACCVPLVWV